MWRSASSMSAARRYRGLAAKPIVDMTVVVADRSDVPATIEALATLGYRHRGDLGIENREAFDHPADLPRHNLYVCPEGTVGVVNQLPFATIFERSPLPRSGMAS